MYEVEMRDEISGIYFYYNDYYLQIKENYYRYKI